MIEVWHPCAGYETHYEVSNLGNVRSIERMVQHSLGGKKIQYGRVLKQGKAGNGYLIVNFCVDKVKSNHSVHRLVARAFIHNEANKPQVNHKDGNKHNNHVDNLEWMTRSENGLHAYRILGKSAWNKGKKTQQAMIDELKAKVAALEAA